MTISSWLESDRTEQVLWRGASSYAESLYVGLYKMVEFLQENSKVDIVVEVGTFQGESTELLAIAFKNVWTIDPYIGYTYFGIALSEIEKKFIDKVLSKHSNIHKLKTTSVEASEQFQNESVDFVYIDGDHSYASVKQDILTWLPKIRTGKYIGGHDYTLVDMKEVCQAVDEIVGPPDLVFDDNSWIKRKVA